jgi:hypothetical protein
VQLGKLADEIEYDFITATSNVVAVPGAMRAAAEAAAAAASAAAPTGPADWRLSLAAGEQPQAQQPQRVM